MHNNTKEKRTSENSEERKGIKPQRVKTSTPAWATDALGGEKEQNEKQKKNKEKEIGSRFQTWLPQTIWSPFTTYIDHTVGSFLDYSVIIK